MSKPTLKIPLYGNCHVENPDGVHIFNCGLKKASWYLKRNLAVVIHCDPMPEGPLTIRLTFTPNGKGHANDAFYLQKRQNICVCCGKKDDLTKHHVVPFMYRKFFPEQLKDHAAYDVLPVCYECHEEYEEYAQQFKTELAAEYKIEKKDAKVLDVNLKKVCTAASALLSCWENKHKIPQKRYEHLVGIVTGYYASIGQPIVLTTDNVKSAAGIRYMTDRTNYKPEGQAVVESLDGIESFVKRWRKHFVETMQPQHLPPHWTIDRPL